MVHYLFFIHIGEEFLRWREEITSFWMNEWQKREISPYLVLLFYFFIYVGEEFHVSPTRIHVIPRVPWGPQNSLMKILLQAFYWHVGILKQSLNSSVNLNKYRQHADLEIAITP